VPLLNDAGITDIIVYFMEPKDNGRYCFDVRPEQGMADGVD
jgi:hypothetical protein